MKTIKNKVILKQEDINKIGLKLVRKEDEFRLYELGSQKYVLEKISRLDYEVCGSWRNKNE